jgi:hypothetical protein
MEYISNLGTKENYFIYLTNIEKDSDILTISIEEPEKELYWKKDLNNKIIKGITSSLGNEISLIKFNEILIKAINQSVDEKDNKLNILFKSLNEIKGTYIKDKRNIKEDDNIKKYLMINIIDKNIIYPIQLEYYANNPNEDLLWKTIKRLKEEKKNESISDLFNLQKENNSLKKYIEILGNQRQIGAVENESYKIKYEKLLEEINKKKNKDFNDNNVNEINDTNNECGFFMTNLEEQFNKKNNESPELKEEMIKLEKKKNEDNGIYEDLIKMLRNEIRNLKTKEKNLTEKILKFEQKYKRFDIINNYNNNYKNNINFLSHRIQTLYRGNNKDKYRSKTSPIKSKSCISIFNKDKSNSILDIKKKSIFNFKKINDNSINKNILNYTKIAMYSNNIFNRRLKNKNSFHFLKKKSTLENNSLTFKSNSNERKKNNNINNNYNTFYKFQNQSFSMNKLLNQENKLKPIIRGKQYSN